MLRPVAADHVVGVLAIAQQCSIGPLQPVLHQAAQRQPPVVVDQPLREREGQAEHVSAQGKTAAQHAVLREQPRRSSDAPGADAGEEGPGQGAAVCIDQHRVGVAAGRFL